MLRRSSSANFDLTLPPLIVVYWRNVTSPGPRILGPAVWYQRALLPSMLALGATQIALVKVEKKTTQIGRNILLQAQDYDF